MARLAKGAGESREPDRRTMTTTTTGITITYCRSRGRNCESWNKWNKWTEIYNQSIFFDKNFFDFLLRGDLEHFAIKSIHSFQTTPARLKALCIRKLP
jgi:hypothetical protein